MHCSSIKIITYPFGLYYKPPLVCTWVNMVVVYRTTWSTRCGCSNNSFIMIVLEVESFVAHKEHFEPQVQFKEPWVTPLGLWPWQVSFTSQDINRILKYIKTNVWCPCDIDLSKTMLLMVILYLMYYRCQYMVKSLEPLVSNDAMTLN